MPASPDDRTPSSDGGDQGSRAGTDPVSAQRAVSSLPEPYAANRLAGVQADRQALETERYIEREVIGVGGSGVVVRAFDKEILRDVAIKILDPFLTSDGSEVDRFAGEARITGQLEHPNIVPVYELGVDQLGRQFLCMKLVRGVTLDDTLNRMGDARLDPVNLAELLQIVVKVCDAVAFAHSRGVLHRDLKPKNVMVSDFGQVYVVDWGIARLRAPSADQEGPRVRVSKEERGEPSDLDPPGSLVGTACYMAPEQVRGEHDQLDERADVFALGATLYQILTGQPPLTGDIVRAIWLRKAAPPVTPPERLVPGGAIPPELSRIAMRAVAYAPTDRYASVAALKRDIEAFQRGAWDLPRVRLPAESVIIREGERGDAAYVILEGRCVAYRGNDGGEVELRVMGPGEVFGETAVFSHKPRTASVRAATEIVLLVVTSEVLSKALGLNSWMGAFVKALADRFREADQRLRSVERGGGVVEPDPSSFRLSSRESGERPTSVSELLDNVEAFQRAAPGLPRATLPSGSVIVREGEPGDAAYVILSGDCVEYRAEGATAVEEREMGPGDVFGEAAVLAGSVAARSVKATTDVELLVVKREVLASALGMQSWMGVFIKSLADRLREAEGRLKSVEVRGGKASAE
jgi:CRP-like cAMP-binding protein